MADRNYSKAFGLNNATPTFGYVWDDSLIISGAGNLPYTGGWRPVNASDFAAGGGGGGSGTTDMGPTILAISSGNANTASASKAFSSSLSNSILAKSGAGTLLNINGYSSNTGTQFIHIYDNWNSGSNLISTFIIDGSNNFGIDFGPNGISMSSGIFVCNSTTAIAQTNGANDVFYTVSFK